MPLAKRCTRPCRDSGGCPDGSLVRLVGAPEACSISSWRKQSGRQRRCRVLPHVYGDSLDRVDRGAALIAGVAASTGCVLPAASVARTHSS
jgi:hypothetical protein